MKADSSVETQSFHAAAPGNLRKSTILLGAAIGMVFGFSAAYVSTLSIFLKPIAATFGWSRAETSAVAMLAQLGLAIGAPLLGGLITRYGAQRVIPVSVICFAAGLFAISQSPGNLVIFGLCTLLLGLTAVGTTPAGYLTPVPTVFDKRLGLAMGLAMFGLGFGNTIMPVVVQAWISGSDWRAAYRLLALSVLLGGCLATVLLFWPTFTKTETRVQAIGLDARSHSGHELSEALSTGRFWMIALILFAISGAVTGAIVHLVPALTDRGMEGGQASRLAAMIGIGVIAGRVGAGVLLDSFHARRVAAGAFAIGGAGLAVIAASSSTSMVINGIGAFLFAFAIGAEGDFIPFFVRRYFGLRKFSLLYGVLFAFFAIGGVAGPIAFGWGFDRFGNYNAVFWAAAATCLLCAMLVNTLGRYEYGVTPASI